MLRNSRVDGRLKKTPLNGAMLSVSVLVDGLLMSGGNNQSPGFFMDNRDQYLDKQPYEGFSKQLRSRSPRVLCAGSGGYLLGWKGVSRIQG